MILIDQQNQEITAHHEKMSILIQKATEVGERSKVMVTRIQGQASLLQTLKHCNEVT